MSIESFSQTDVGRQRDHNEDDFVVDLELGLFVLCDGMGGHAAGEVASEIAVNTVRDVISRNRGVIQDFAENESPQGRAKISALIVEAVETACAKVFEAAHADAEKAGMGTTLEMVLVINQIGFMGHVGDSRLYLRRDGEVHQLSEDHSFVREMVRAGQLTEEQAKHSPVGNVITRAVGIAPTVKVDTLAFDILPNDILLLCSDGLSDYLEDEAELAALLADRPLDASAQSLIDLANERGGKDNITTLLIRALADEGNQRRATTRDVGLEIKTLKRVRLFKHLTYKELVMLLNITTVEEHDAGVELISEGDHETDFYVVLEGRLEVTRQGHELAQLTEGDHCGEMELIMARSRSATVTTLTKSRFLVVQRADFIALLKAHEHLGVKLLWSFLQTMSLRLHYSNTQLSDTQDDDEALPIF